MKLGSPVARYRKDYKAPVFSIEAVDLVVNLHETRTQVVNTMQILRLREDSKLQLDGEHLTLVKVELDGQLLAEGTDYEVIEGQLTIFDFPQQGELRVTTLLNPAANTAFEGLYKSGDAYCTQCEAEGFRRITYFLDRPDVLSLYTTTIVADKNEFPQLLANGNLIDKGESEEGKHWVKWHDPHPKPCYLFALVAGNFDCLRDNYRTMEGRDVELELYVDKGNLSRAAFAMESLKNAMIWDEKRFGLAYDLDIYMIVAVDFFNMGAMENKGLNIFNSKYVLADKATATDQDFLNVESVIGHEYFHNWTGNRITCRDWFQLSLKEGLTVFRDQEFSSDRGMRDVNRIQDARIMRTHQFDEDASPMAHPIRPDQVMEMNNFYTVTVYNKGAEVIRMLHTLLGEEGFQQGMRLYVERHDGQAVTCEDFVSAMEDANKIDLKQFRHWYSQAGTPVVSIATDYDKDSETLTVTAKQTTPATPGQNEKQPFHIPIKSEIFSNDGTPLNAEGWPEEGVFELKAEEQIWTLKNVPEGFIFAPLANFSAPIKVKYDSSDNQSFAVAALAKDPFLRWDAVQQIYLTLIHRYIEAEDFGELSEFDSLMQSILNHAVEDPSISSLLLQLPSEEAVASDFDIIPVESIQQALTTLKAYICNTFGQQMEKVWTQLSFDVESFDSLAISHRMLGNVLVQYLALLDTQQTTHAIQHQFALQENMTLSFGALSAAVQANHSHAEVMLREFRAKWASNTLVMDKWFSVQALTGHDSTVENVERLLNDELFDWNKPNRVYALLSTFSHNLSQLHRADGAGYRLMEAAITRLNDSNPQVASRLISPLLKWRRLEEGRSKQLRGVLERLKEHQNLSKDLFEKVEKSLADA
ncbi:MULTISPECIES: aminopeptidase N [Gammaproteobacteria]|uniref:aminopeptidase N n=1 Tax=Gammaproteobacteria TaxID=1236 RepID=UPI000DCFCBEA|nr:MULTISPECIES: aminopeptidase N [Gammaproteobacteria]RTE87213.1 aminopeptidase N [Aliidiomarina sp. B3213]TCZ92999.1 aminopeptidase N [Lysobacter sp. N42]